MNGIKNITSKKYIASFMLVVYTLLFFANSSHRHNEFSHWDLEKGGKAISQKDQLSPVAQDCYACFLLLHAVTETPLNSSPILLFAEKIESVQFFIQLHVWLSTKYSFSLRGPPSFL